MTAVMLRLLLIAVYFKKGELQSQILLSSSQDIVPVNTTVVLTCTKINGSLVETKWETTMLQGEEAVCAFIGNKCLTTNFLNSNDLYECTCNTNGTFSVQVRYVNRHQDGAIWSCREGYTTSNTVVIKVSVPVTHAILQVTGNRTLYENSSTTLTCSTSYSQPPAKIRWYISDELSALELVNTTAQDVYVKREYDTSNDNLTSTVEKLNYTVNRSVHGWQFYCNATSLESNPVMSNNITIFVIYAPDGPPLLHGFKNGSTYAMTEADIASLSCSVEGGYPLGKLIWMCQGFTNSTAMEINAYNKVTTELSWIATRFQGKTCMCQLEHVLLNESIFVNIDVLYPPDVPIIQLQYEMDKQNVSLDCKLIEKKTYRLFCNADGNPPPFIYYWNGPKTMKLSNNRSLFLPNVQRKDAGNYSCHAQNIMRPTHDVNYTGGNNVSVIFDILYPPDIGLLVDRNISEGSTLNVTCKSIPGNPSLTQIIWTNRNGKEWFGQLLSIKNVSRTEDDEYTCTVNNSMIPTAGSLVEGRTSRSFHLSVLYKSRVARFFIEGYKELRTVTINEGENIQFNCEIDSNPGSTISLYFQGRKNIFILHNARNLSYLQKNASCLQTGIYSCTGKNAYNNGQPSIEIMSLQVRCSPRHSVDTISTTVYTSINGSAKFRFKALAYPEPGASGFKWYKLSNSEWIPLISSTNIDISSSDLQSKLTVTSVTESDYGKYMLTVENDVGRFEQLYTLLKSQDFSVRTVENSAQVISIIIGCVVSVVVIIISSVLVILCCRRYKRKDGCNERTRIVGLNDESFDMKTITEEKMPYSNEAVYEEIKPDKNTGITAGMEHNYEKLKPDKDGKHSKKQEKHFVKLDKDAADSVDPIYTNLMF